MNYRLLFALPMLCFMPASGALIVSETGALNDCCRSVTGYSSWTQSVTYTNVSIFANLFDLDGEQAAQGTAYLVNQIGPGTTPANEVTAPVSISITNTSSLPVQLFSGLTLGPGNYYLVIHPADARLEWDDGVGFTTRTLGFGVTQVEVPDMNQGPIAPYPPASSFDLSGNAIYTVTGDLSTSSTPGVPEPATAALLPAGLAALLYIRRLRS